VEELGISTDHMPDTLIEGIILAVRRASSLPPGELEEDIYEYRLGEGTEEEADTA
jgi:hypothetical protein